MTVAQRSRAAELIGRKGQTVTIVGTASGTYDPATATSSNQAYDKTAKAVVLPLSAFRKASDTNLKQGDEQMMLAGLDASGAALPQPPVNSIVTLADGAKRTLISVERLNPEGDGPIYYDCIVRGNAA